MAQIIDGFATDPLASRWNTPGDGTVVYDSANAELDLPGGNSVVYASYIASVVGALAHEAQCSTVFATANRLIGPCVRALNTGAVTFYGLNVDTTGDYVVYRYDAGVRTLVGQAASGLTLTDGHWYTLRMSATGIGASVALSIWGEAHGASKPVNDPGWIGSDLAPSTVIVDSTTPLVSTSNERVGIGARDPGVDYDTRTSYWRARAYGDRSTIWDGFDRADGSLGGDWTDLFSGGMQISSGAAGSTSSSENAAYYSAFTPAADHAAAVRLVADGDGGPFVRATPGNNFYVGIVRTSQVRLVRCVSGSYTELDSAAGITIGGVARLEAEGTTIRLYYNNALMCQATDGTHTTGYAGLYNYSAAGLYDDFQVANLGAPPASAVAWMQQSVIVGGSRTRYLPVL